MICPVTGYDILSSFTALVQLGEITHKTFQVVATTYVHAFISIKSFTHKIYTHINNEMHVHIMQSKVLPLKNNTNDNKHVIW